MYLRVGSFLRPFNEANASITYQPNYDVFNNIVTVDETWGISGRIIQQTDATQANMTRKIRILERDFNQHRPDLVFIEDDMSTETPLALRRQHCLDGPKVVSASFPSPADDVYATGQTYGVTFTAKRTGSSGRVLLEFQETLTTESGGRVDRYVGGAINWPERQTVRQHKPFRVVQRGSAVGMFGYPVPPGPIWPAALMEFKPPEKDSPRILGPIQQEFRISWEYMFEWPTPLLGNPHRYTIGG